MTRWHIRQATAELANGGIIAYPTDTVYGLGCDPFNAAAVLRLLALKQRSIRQGLILVAGNLQQLEPCLLPLTAAVKRRVTATCADPVTWVLPCHDWVPVWLRGVHSSLAVRISKHPVIVTLCEHRHGPLVSSSANRRGRHPATSALGVRRAFGGQLDYILHSTHPGTRHPSQIRDGVNGKILRDKD